MDPQPEGGGRRRHRLRRGVPQQAPTNLAFTEEYLAAYDQALAASKTPEELQAKVKALYPDAALDIVLKIGSEASLEPAKRTARK